jgi:probable phosphoglycerate mutase
MTVEDARPRAWLVRHGETEWSKSGRHTGMTDVPLTPVGREQARGIAQRLDGRDFAVVLASPLSRALETARLAGFGDQVELDEDLREWDYGEYEGITTPQIRETVPGWTVWRHGVPGGETAAQVAERVDRVVKRLQAADGDVLVFGHGHLLRVLAARWLGLEVADGRRFALHTSTLSVLGWERETPVLERWNDIAEPR